jgi:hypothetical protein
VTDAAGGARRDTRGHDQGRRVPAAEQRIGDGCGSGPRRRAGLLGGRGKLEPAGTAPVADVRYLDVLALSDGRHRIYYEARLPDESHELRTELVEPA